MATGIPKTQWNGDLNESAFKNSLDTCISYEGKLAESDILKIPAAKCEVLTSTAGEGENRLYYGDNLPILASLLNEPSIRGKVRLVYIDPPFATNSVFQSRSQTDAYSDLLAGAPYVEFIRQRLIWLRELMAEDGSVYVHLDENMAFHIKLIMDEVFGRRNFRNWITRKKCNPKNYTRKTYGNISDFILFYTKSDTYVWNRPLEQWTEERALKEYEYIEKETGRRYKKVPLHAPGVRNGETGKPWRNINPPPGKHWQFPPKTLDEMDARGEIFWSSNGNPRRKIYLDESLGIPVQDIWLEFRDAHNQNIKITGYPTEKNPELVARIVRASSNPGDLVLDCFSGSGTTLAVAEQLRRRWIGIDSSAEAIATTLRRFAKGCDRMGDFVAQKTSARPIDTEPQQLSLFDSDELSGHVDPLAGQKEANSNFSVYAAQPYSGELEGAIAHFWKSLQ